MNAAEKMTERNEMFEISSSLFLSLIMVLLILCSPNTNEERSGAEKRSRRSITTREIERT